jgi:hypothetical protein
MSDAAAEAGDRGGGAELGSAVGQDAATGRACGERLQVRGQPRERIQARSSRHRADQTTCGEKRTDERGGLGPGEGKRVWSIFIGRKTPHTIVH